MGEYFECKYLATSIFFTYECNERLSFIQAAGRCMVDFSALLSENSVMPLAINSEITGLWSKGGK
jgi:hypothetical protein